MESFVSLLDVVTHINKENNYIPYCKSMTQIFGSLPASITYLSGFEYHLSSQHIFCDSLICVLTRDVFKFKKLLRSQSISDLQSVADIVNISSTLLGLQELMCVTDHVWFEFDAEPNAALSLFLGNHSSIQSISERLAISNGAIALNTKLLNDKFLNYVPQFDFSERIEKLFSQLSGWLLSEIGFMSRRPHDSHVKLLLVSPQVLSLLDVINLSRSICMTTDICLETLIDSGLPDILNQFNYVCQLSIALFPTSVTLSFEILPDFNSTRKKDFFEFWEASQSALYLLGSTKSCASISSEILEGKINNVSYESRLHHFKITPLDCGEWRAKIYRDLRCH